MNFTGKKVLIAYFSHSGNTQTLAKMIQSAVGGDLYAIVPQTPYPTHYDTVVAQAKKESESNFLPPIDPLPKNLGDYSIVFIGSPIWWYTVAPPVASFCSTAQLAHKTLIPFVTHEGGGKAHSFTDIKKLQLNADVLEGFVSFGSKAAAATKDMSLWLESL